MVLSIARKNKLSKIVKKDGKEINWECISWKGKKVFQEQQIIWELGAPDIAAWTSLYKLSEDHSEFDMCLGDLQYPVDAPRCHVPFPADSGIARSPHAPIWIRYKLL